MYRYVPLGQDVHESAWTVQVVHEALHGEQVRPSVDKVPSGHEAMHVAL